MKLSIGKWIRVAALSLVMPAAAFAQTAGTATEQGNSPPPPAENEQPTQRPSTDTAPQPGSTDTGMKTDKNATDTNQKPDDTHKDDAAKSKQGENPSHY